MTGPAAARPVIETLQGDVVYVRGHISPLAFIRLYREWSGECVRRSEVRHEYWRNVPASNWEQDDWPHLTYTVSPAAGPGHGAYSVTVYGGRMPF